MRRFTIKLEGDLFETLKRNSLIKGHKNCSEYLRMLIKNDCLADPTPKNGHTEDNLKRLESHIHLLLNELQQFTHDLSILANVNMKALTVLLSFHDVEAIPRDGLEAARQFMSLQMDKLRDYTP
jgi:hypothetical protein